jgi:signal transduction histidine kinase
LTQRHKEFVSAFQKGPVMIETGGDPESDLLSRMSHEMRTPLSAILGFAQLMESGTPSPTVSQKRSIDRILQAGWYLQKLINMTRELALIESGTLSLSLEPVPLADVMLDVEAMIELQAQMRGVRVTFPLFEFPCSVSADRIRLQEVLGNLLTAAIDCSEADGTVVVNCEAHSPEWIRISINDGGEGLSVEEPAPSFQPFDGLERKGTAVDGSGIGMQLAARLIEWMGGTINTKGVGRARKIFSFDLKRMLVPMAAGRTSKALEVAFNASDAPAATLVTAALASSSLQ